MRLLPQRRRRSLTHMADERTRVCDSPTPCPVGCLLSWRPIRGTLSASPAPAVAANRVGVYSVALLVRVPLEDVEAGPVVLVKAHHNDVPGGLALAVPTPHLTDHGGPRLTAVQVHTVFWGHAWTQAPVSGVIGLSSLLEYILTSGYMDVLAGYGGVDGRRTGTITMSIQSPP